MAATNAASCVFKNTSQRRSLCFFMVSGKSPKLILRLLQWLISFFKFCRWLFRAISLQDNESLKKKKTIFPTPPTHICTSYQWDRKMILIASEYNYNFVRINLLMIDLQKLAVYKNKYFFKDKFITNRRLIQAEIEIFKKAKWVNSSKLLFISSKIDQTWWRCWTCREREKIGFKVKNQSKWWYGCKKTAVN